MLGAHEVRDVLVIGGGPAGAATATLLKQRGHDVALVDEARFPRDKICGESVSPGAWSALHAMGVVDAVRRLEPQPIRGMSLSAPDGTRFRGLYAEGQAPGFAVRRSRFDAALLQRARDAGVEVREGMRAVGLVRGATGTVCGVECVNGAEPQVLRARVLVAADGRRSRVARELGLLGEHRRLRKFAVRGYWDGMEGLGELGEMHVACGGYCGVAPLSARSANVAFVLDRTEMRASAAGLEGFYRTTLRRWPRLAERLERATLLDPPRAIGPLALEARGVWAPGVVLVGDAAGFYDPFTGEGVTLALRSAELAAEAVHDALASGDPGRLRAYAVRRREATRDKFRFNRMLQQIVGRPWLANLVARRLASRQAVADRLVGIAGDFVPARSALGPSFLRDLLF
jgi:geranylgeranyl reductase family protein